MSSSAARLPALSLPGLRPDGLGNYLASLGLLRLLARKWPSVRIAWPNHVLHVVGGPVNLGALLDELMVVAEQKAWTPYERGWAEDQKRSTKTKSGMALALWQAAAEEQDLELFAAHAVPHARVSFNPLLGSGGNAGKRAFSVGWKQAVKALAPPSPKKPGKKETEARRAARESADRQKADEERHRNRSELESLLLGKPLTWMIKKLNAASWFSDANKLYNSGQSPFRDGVLSPWAMMLACEGLAFWAGSASRRLGARARVSGAFPFVFGVTAGIPNKTRPVRPTSAGEAGRDMAEVWVPLWERPMTLPEARALFLRGRAEVGGRGVLTPSGFATAIVRRGVDAGVSEFLRFSLGRTTSANTFEPRLEGSFPLERPAEKGPSPTTVPAAMERVLDLVDRLPDDYSPKKKRWEFKGLKGPIEAGMLNLAASLQDPERGCALLDSVVAALDKVDRNRSFRERAVSWEPLPIGYLPSLFGGDPPGVEARLAMALVSAFPLERPFTLYRFGVERKYGRFEHSARPPARWVWGLGALPRVLAKTLSRRTLDWESARKEQGQQSPDSAPHGLPATAAHVQRWLKGAIDEVLLARWIARLALFDWRFIPSEVCGLAPAGSRLWDASAPLCLFGLIAPLFDERPVRAGAGVRRPQTDLLPRESGARTPGVARTLTHLIGSGQIGAAVRLAASRYAMASVPLANTNAPWRVLEPDRLLASVLFPITDRERVTLIERWFRPRRQQGDEAHG